MFESVDNQNSVTLLRGKPVAAHVDYHNCGQCGFRLMRVETTLINQQKLIVSQCPICEQYKAGGGDSQIPPSVEAREKCFDLWLAQHGLDRDTLERHYHLAIENFFDDEV